MFSLHNGTEIDLLYDKTAIIMKLQSFLFILLIIFFALFLSTCCSTKNQFQKKPPFAITEASIADWVGGVPHTGGTIITLAVQHVPAALKPGYIYWGNQKAKLEIKKSSKAIFWIGRFPLDATIIQKKDINMQKDAKGEYGNSAPVMRENREISLGEDEVAVSYFYKGKTYYYLVENIQRIDRINYPSAPPND